MNKKVEVIANIILAFVGITLGIIMFVVGHKDLSLVMFSIALASILYQFLGGIAADSSIQLGALKFGGAAAVLMGFMFFFKKFIFIPSGEYSKLNVTEMGWVPISLESGQVKTVRIGNGLDSLTFPDKPNFKELRKKHRYLVLANDKQQFDIVLASDKTDTVGYADMSDVSGSSLLGGIKLPDDFNKPESFTLYPFRKNTSSKQIDGLELPFFIEVYKSARFSIKPNDPGQKAYVQNKTVEKNNSYIIPGESRGESYLVVIESANSSDTTGYSNYSKWMVHKLVLGSK